MKKIIAFTVAVVIFIGFLVIYNYKLDEFIASNKNNLYYLVGDEKFNSLEAAKACLNNKESDSILVLGSSELSAFNTEIVGNGNSNFNMYIIGRGYTKCLQSALTLGAIQNATKINKVVLIISPQWFEKDSTLSSEIFASRFQKNHFNMFLKNKKISYEMKQQVINELKKLEKSDEVEFKKIQQYENAYLNGNIIDRVSLEISDNIGNTKQKIKLIKLLNEFKGTTKSNETVKFENYDFKQLLDNADKEGKNACTNNEWGIYDDYYNKYVKNSLLQSKNSKSYEDFSNIEEYEYLEMFLKICNELEVKPLIINVPVNGIWYDYVGVSKTEREKYYKKINEISLKYGAKVADFSQCEYEKYFLKDIMHIGWRGWIKVDEEIYKFYKEQ